MTGKKRTSRANVIAAFAAIYVIWGSTYLAILMAIQTLPPLLMAGARFSVAGLFRCGSPHHDRAKREVGFRDARVSIKDIQSQ